MAGCILILDLSGDTLRAGAFSTRAIEPLEFTSVRFERGDDHSFTPAMKAALESVRKWSDEKGLKPVRVLAGVSATSLSVRILPIPFEDRKKMAEVLPFELGGLLHINVDEAVIDGMNLAPGKALAVALEKAYLRDYLAALKDLDLDPFWAGVPVLSVPALLREDGEGTKAFVNRDSLVVAEKGRLKFFKPFKRLEGVRLASAYLEAESMKIDEAFVADWAVESVAEMLPWTGTVKGIDLPGRYPAEGAAILALSLALKNGAIDETINLRKGEFEYTKEKTAARKRLKTASAAVIFLALLLVADIYIKYLGASKELSSYNDTMRASYLELFPADRNVVDPLYQLEAKMKALRNEAAVLGGGRSVLDIMNTLARSGGELKVRFSELSVTREKVIAKGEAPSFEAANSFSERLAPGPLFSEARVSDVKAGPGGGAVFSISATLR